MEPIHDTLKQLLSPERPAAYHDYLAFLAERAPHDIAEQIADDGEPDLGLSKWVSLADLIHPLHAMSFPDQRAMDVADILGYILIGYGIGFEENPTKHDPYKIIYTSSLFLYCYLKAGARPSPEVFLLALAMIARVSMQQDIETRVQVCRFLGSIIEMVSDLRTALDAAPVSGVLIAMDIIAGSLVRDLSIAAEQSARSEQLLLKWSENERDYPHDSNSKAMTLLRRWSSEMFGRGGEIRRATGRFFSLWGKDSNSGHSESDHDS